MSTIQKKHIENYVLNDKDMVIGETMAVSSLGTVVVTGVVGEPTSLENSSVNIYRYVNSKYLLELEITQADVKEPGTIGSTVAISEDGKLVAVSFHNCNYESVYVYRYKKDWRLVSELRSPVEEVTKFGANILIDTVGSTIAVSAHLTNNGDIKNAGAVHIYDIDEKGKFRITDTIESVLSGENDWFGIAMAGDCILSKIAIASRKKYFVDDTLSVGIVDVYVDNGKQYSYESTVTSTVVEGCSNFGRSLSMDESGTVLVVSGTTVDNEGIAYVARWDTSTDEARWIIEDTLVSVNGYSAYGYDVIISKAGCTVLVVGTVSSENMHRGTDVVVYRKISKSWDCLDVVHVPVPVTNVNLKTPVAISSDGYTVFTVSRK